MENHPTDYSSSENHSNPPSPPDSHNLPSQSDSSSAVTNILSKPSYAAVVAKRLSLPVATVAECSSFTTSSSLPANDSEAMSEDLKLSQDSSKGLTDDGSSFPQVQVPQSPPSTSEEDDDDDDDEALQPTSQQDQTIQNDVVNDQQLSATHVATLVTESKTVRELPSPCDSYNISFDTSLLFGIDISSSSSQSDTSASINSSSNKPTCAAVAAKWLTLPSAATVAECSSATTAPANNCQPLAEGLKLALESSKGFIDDGSSSLQVVQVPRSPASPPSEKQITGDDETLLVPISQLNGSNDQQLSATDGATSATGPHNSSLSRNTPRGATGYRGSKIHMVNNVVPQHHGINRNHNIHKNFHSRNMHMPPRGHTMFARPPLRPPPPPPPAMPAFYSNNWYFPRPPVMPPVPPYGFSYGFPADLGSHIPYHATPMPFVGAPYYVPLVQDYSMFNRVAPDLELHAKIVTQVHYYFSIDNLAKDIYLRKQMNLQGWIPICIIASFPMMKKLTDSIEIITDALQTSSVVEISGNKIRRRDDWERWILPNSFQLS